jgi:putative transposase
MIGHIRSNAKDKNIQIELLDGHKGHIHFLIRLKPDQPLSKVIQLIKGESSHRLTITGHRPPVFNLKKIEDLLVTLYFYLLNHE